MHELFQIIHVFSRIQQTQSVVSSYGGRGSRPMYECLHGVYSFTSESIIGDKSPSLFVCLLVGFGVCWVLVGVFVCLFV